MNACLRFGIVRRVVKPLLLLLLLQCSMVQAVTGPEVAQLLNTRYSSIPQACPGNHAAYFCSGVLVSGLMGGLPIRFWEHTDNAIALGARSFSYLRRDQGIRSLTQDGGMVFSDPFTAISQGKSLDVLCAYPLVTSIHGNYGCGTGGSLDDPGSCAALGVSDAAGWLTHFQQQGQQPALQCSLSSRIATQFRASLLAHEQLGGSWVTQPNQVQIRNWDAQAPAQVPVQALFYDTTRPGGLRVAQHNQRDYHAATGQWLPILRLDLAGVDGAVFGFNLQDQLYLGYEVARRLSARYFDTAITCADGRPSFYCNGVLLRGTDATALYHSWNPSHYSIANGGVSTTFLRADSRVPRPVWPQGFLFKEVAAPAIHPTTLRCGYPYDGHTGLMPDPCAGYGRCADLGVNSLETWMQLYQTRPYESCSFAPTADGLQLLMEVRKTAAMPPYDWNEFILLTWPQDIPEQLPIDAVFYSHEAYYPNDSLAGARYLQDDYFKMTGRFWPIVQLDLRATDDLVFSFTPDDQCLADSCPPPPQAAGVQSMESWFREHGQ
ncbi:hypothetical protein FGE05_26640 [Pseudomonas sp. ICMP22404]|uniref:hypothetical protein n=1 Tax=Pseudomonas sp. ICMP22404 TaxID=2583807 RepID=UPI001119DED7|nr:hypothetical protein [Pseudomonas sp. ICMP22404]TNF79138.1 hypothetical protein FGE05_26640 [Pseudomonas sp. ICMP22404]